MTVPVFTKRFLVYIPAYNCASCLPRVFAEMPQWLQESADFLVIDNCSPDGVSEVAKGIQESGTFGGKIQVIRTSSNVDYAGSQKLAYRIALQSPSVQWVMMLHGDGQYAPALLDLYKPYLDSDHGCVYGYRTKTKFPGKEETPWGTYLVIKVLNVIENLLTGYWIREWHSGFVMHSRSFLAMLDIPKLTSTRHIDGNLLFAAKYFKKDPLAIPIWKRYEGFDPFVGWERFLYGLHVIGLMFSFRFTVKDLALKNPDNNRVDPSEFTKIC